MLLTFSVIFVAVLELTRLPAALLIGPMLAAIIAGTNGATVRVPRFCSAPPRRSSAASSRRRSRPTSFSVFYEEWPLFLGVVVATVTASSLLGWLISRWRILPGTTAVWGSSPGAATAMVLMAGAFGADQRLVAFMQYLRVIFVSMTAALLPRCGSTPRASKSPPSSGFRRSMAAFAATLGIALSAAWREAAAAALALLPRHLHLRHRRPSRLWREMQLPPWLLAVSYAMVGWSIGLNFTRPILRHATRALPQIIASIVALIAFCGGLAFMIGHVLGIDPLTAYLATSPGGMDSVAIIAAAAQNVDISFVMALQIGALPDRAHGRAAAGAARLPAALANDAGETGAAAAS